MLSLLRRIIERLFCSPNQRLLVAVCRNDIRGVLNALSSGACVDARTFRSSYSHFLVPYHRTALHYACMAGNGEMVECLLNNGATLAVFDKPRHLNPAHLAAHGGHYEVLDILYEKDSSIGRINDRFGVSPLDMVSLDTLSLKRVERFASSLDAGLPSFCGRSHRSRL